MHHLIPSFTLAVRSLFAPGMFGVIVGSVLLTIVVLISFFIAASAAFIWLFSNVPLLAWAGTIASGMLAWFFFPAIMPIIINFFDSRIAALIERQDYPAALAPRELPFWPEFWHDARFTALTLFLNLIALPLYLIPPINAVVFYLLNGYLLGREFFVMVARRRLMLAESEAMRKQHARLVTFAGIALAIAATIPVINLFAPFWGIAVMTHLYHRLSGTAPAEVLPPYSRN